MLCIYGMWVLQYRKDRWGGWLEFRCQIDWMAAGDLVEIMNNYKNEYGVANKEDGVEFYFDLDLG